MRWRAALFLLMACSDDDGAPARDASVDTPRGKVDAASDAPAPDATSDAARDARADAGLTCADLACAEDQVCQYTFCDEPGCVQRPACMKVVESCDECSPFERCRAPICVKAPNPCPTVCEYVEPRCEPKCKTGSVCVYDGASCDDAGVCTPIAECTRAVQSCDSCRSDETCEQKILVDFGDVTVCVAN